MNRFRWTSLGISLLAAAMTTSPVGAAGGPGSNPNSTSITIGHAAPDSLDPGVTASPGGLDIVNQMFRGLTAFDSRTGQLGLDLAADDAASPDLKTWTFDIKSTALWSDGRPITAADEVFAIQRAESPSSSNPYSAEVISLIASVTAVSMRTVQFQLTQPAAYFPALLTLPLTRPEPRQVVQADGAAWVDPANIVVSGAYRLTSQSSTAIVLTRDDLTGRTATIDQVTYDIGDPSGFASAFESGALDYVDPYLIGGPVAVEADPNLAPYLTVTGPDDVTEFLNFNAAYGSTSNSDVRHALSAATDRASLSSLVNGTGNFTAKTLTPPEIFGSVPASAGVGISYDPTAANAYKNSAGSAWPSSVTVRYPCGSQSRQQEAAFLQSNWENVFGGGFTVNTECEPAGQFFSEIYHPDPSAQADVSIYAWQGDYPDANNWLVDNTTITNRWGDAGYSAAVADAAATADTSRRQADYTQAEGILLDDVAAIATLYYRPDAFLSQTRLTVVGDRVENWTVG